MNRPIVLGQRIQKFSLECTPCGTPVDPVPAKVYPIQQHLILT
jgi:hypothetical protein